MTKTERDYILAAGDIVRSNLNAEETGFAPNPASSWTEIDYTLPAEEKRATLVITNALGVNVMTTELIGNQGRKTFFLENLPSGVYTYFIRCGEYVVTGKLMKK